MAVQPVTAANSAYVTKSHASGDQIDNPNSALGKNDFLMMLVTKLKYQDPTNPVDDSAFTGEMAQYSTLEQMTNLNTTTTEQSTSLANLNTNIASLILMQNSSQAAGLIGKTVTLTVTKLDTDGVTVLPQPDVKGQVTTVKYENGLPMIVVGGTEYGLSSIKEISA